VGGTRSARTEGEVRGEIRGLTTLSPTPHGQIFYETINPPGVAFHNSLDDTNASITPGYPQKPLCHPFITLSTRITNPE
jgi:hypothetical protein